MWLFHKQSDLLDQGAAAEETSCPEQKHRDRWTVVEVRCTAMKPQLPHSPVRVIRELESSVMEVLGAVTLGT